MKKKESTIVVIVFNSLSCSFAVKDLAFDVLQTVLFCGSVKESRS